ncbi:hypothetical protein U3A58_05450 [Algoriphagus sp. C2-6-M1]|uniref:hypothetical protein n=1 Tax=Algoriphagus persicinus TaxID=3108754 RepID=UPI002B38C487|nr:hypothetical protein [Algoriphagus sp. C2-6-M1]MEB2779832.1 hypothetical protein [Algoriphagus sp. C2-6-M1]
MALPTKSRRAFLVKGAFLAGLFSMANFNAFASFYRRAGNTNVRLLHGSSHWKGLQDRVAQSRLIVANTIFFSNDEVWYSEGGSGVFKGAQDDFILVASLFGRNQMNGSLSDFEAKQWINSNLTFDESLRTDKVSPYQIINNSGLKVGVMGIGFVDSNQPISTTIQKMNEIALDLKNNRKCDMVFCLTDCPNQVFPHFTARDLAENSKNINQFFVSSDKVKLERLLVLRNGQGHQVLLSRKNDQSERIDLTEVSAGQKMTQSRFN